MGFRDLHLFNKAMLGKQGWRLITRPDSLCTRVLKGRYFHDGEFLSCTRKKHASHTWRAIFAGREILGQGLIKRIGDGASTNIWQDRWISMHFEARPLTPGDGQEVNLVSDLLNADGQWNEELINETFFPVDANAILRIPLRPQEEDWWAWELDKHGEYTVKSAYRKLAQSDMPEQGGSGDESWKRVWKLNVPPKVKVLWWRVLHESLPTRDTLNRRHVEPVGFCERCGAERETIKHIFMECTTALAFWREVKILTGVKLPRLHTQYWASDILRDDVCSEKDRCILVIGMYSLWTQRNRHRHGEEQLPVRVAV